MKWTLYILLNDIFFFQVSIFKVDIMIPEIVIVYQPAAGDNEAFCNKDTYKRHEKDYK